LALDPSIAVSILKTNRVSGWICHNILFSWFFVFFLAFGLFTQSLELLLSLHDAKTTPAHV